MHQISAGALPQTPRGPYSTPQTLAGFKGLLLEEGKGREGRGGAGSVRKGRTERGAPLVEISWLHPCT